MLTIKLPLITGHCRYDLGSGAALIRSEFTLAINTVHIVDASRYATNVMKIVIQYHYIDIVCIYVGWDKVVSSQWTIDSQFKIYLLVKLLY